MEEPAGRPLDVVFVHPDSSAQACQGLATTYAAIKPQTWEPMLMQSRRARGSAARSSTATPRSRAWTTPLRGASRRRRGGSCLMCRDEAWKTYISSPAYLALVERRVGRTERETVEAMSTVQLRRRLLGD